MKRLAIFFLVSAILAARPAAACCQLGGTACGDPFAVDCNNGVVCFPPWRTCASCTCTVTNGGRTCLANASEPGTVATLQVTKSAQAGQLDLSWSASCAGAGRDYAVHEGTIGDWYSHLPLRCTTAGTAAATVMPSGGNRYYLLAPIFADFTGSLGTGSSGAQRPDGAPSCTDDRAIAPCP